jgi:hypothetical protein
MSSVATAAATPERAPARSTDRRDGAETVEPVWFVDDAVVTFMAVLLAVVGARGGPSCTQRTDIAAIDSQRRNFSTFRLGGRGSAQFW